MLFFTFSSEYKFFYHHLIILIFKKKVFVFSVSLLLCKILWKTSASLEFKVVFLHTIESAFVWKEIIILIFNLTCFEWNFFI